MMVIWWRLCKNWKRGLLIYSPSKSTLLPPWLDMKNSLYIYGCIPTPKKLLPKCPNELLPVCINKLLPVFRYQSPEPESTYILHFHVKLIV